MTNVDVCFIFTGTVWFINVFKTQLLVYIFPLLKTVFSFCPSHLLNAFSFNIIYIVHPYSNQQLLFLSLSVEILFTSVFFFFQPFYLITWTQDLQTLRSLKLFEIRLLALIATAVKFFCDFYTKSRTSSQTQSATSPSFFRSSFTFVFL